MKDFITALQFLTTLRVAKEEIRSTEEFAASMRFFPLIGLLIGGILAGVGYAAGLKLSPGAVGAILLVAEIMLTGGLHLDGYMDTMDGIFSGRSRERILEIMKDSRVGAHAVIALGGLFILKYGLLVEVASHKAWGVLVIMPALGRFTMGIGTALFPYARPEGLGKGFAEYFTRLDLAVTLIYSGAAAVFFLGWQGILITAAVGIWGYVFSKFVTGRIGGLTGDVYGALSELSEVIVLLCAIILPLGKW